MSRTPVERGWQTAAEDVSLDLAMRLDHAHFWGAAQTLDDLGELTARWLLGDILYHPGYGAPVPDPETESLIPDLVEFNRHGLITVSSQPTCVWPNGNEQSAYVTGFCTSETARLLQGICRQHGLLVWATCPNPLRRWLARWQWHGHAFYDGGEIRNILGCDLSAAAVRNLLESWQVIIQDPLPSRPNYLWRTIAGALKETP